MSKPTPNNAVVVICTRPDSRRLPRKAFKRIAGYPAIEHILFRLRVRRDMIMAGLHEDALPVILAVPTFCRDYDYLLDKYKITIFRGFDESPLHRMADAVTDYSRDNAKPDFVVRITHDDILIDYEEMVRLVKETQATGSGYGFSPGILEGAGVEVISTQNLVAAQLRYPGPIEHISYFVRGDGLPKPLILALPPRLSIQRSYRLTMDYAEDAFVLESVLRNLGSFAKNERICEFLDVNAWLTRINEIPAVSVYMCAHNTAKWIGRAMASVPSTCSLGKVEFVVVEDCSTDATLDKILNENSSIHKLIVNEENRGLSSSCNIALDNCRGRYIMRLDSDDILKFWALNVMLDKIQKTNASVVYSGYGEIDPDNEIIGTNLDPRVHHHAGCALMDARVIKELKFREGLRHWDGLELYKRLVQGRPNNVAYVDESCWLYRRHKKSMSAELTPERARILAQIENNELSEPN